MIKFIQVLKFILTAFLIKLSLGNSLDVQRKIRGLSSEYTENNWI